MTTLRKERHSTKSKTTTQVWLPTEMKIDTDQLWK